MVSLAVAARGPPTLLIAPCARVKRVEEARQRLREQGLDAGP